jgi:serine/threonine protein kinase/tetratricopeptide (TPR) repeat protein
VADLRERLQSGLADRYRIERELGRGGMATVYLARDLKHDRLVALKVLRPELAEALGPERFQREIETVARLQHPHILTVHDSGETAGQLWFTMPFVEGESLRDRLRREQQLPVEVALGIATEAARALQYAHEHGVIHRDIKPENLLLTKDGSALVADFGIARALSAGDDRLTATGISVGTPAYMSPEQGVGDRHLDARSDVYSLATVLYEMLAGQPPFTGATAQALNARRLAGEVPRLRHVRPSVPESVEQAVNRALALVPADRFASAAEFARALGPTVATPTATPAVPLASAVRTGRGRASARVWRVPIAVMALGLGIGVLFAWRRSHSGVDKTGGAKVLAVLPFENQGDSADAYFADGVANDLRTKLTQVPGLQVIARGSSNEYRKTTKTQQQIARELGVDYLLTATVQWEKVAGGASRVRVSPELVDVSPNHAPRSKWGQQFDAALTDVFQVQADIATRVAEALNVALGAKQQQMIAQQPTANLTAYNAFLRGEAAVERAQFQENDYRKVGEALHFYEEAVTLDPTFVNAWVELALWYTGLASSGQSPTDSSKARRALEHAVALAPGTPDVQLALGYYTQIVRRDPAQARAHYEAGLKVAPGNARLVIRMAGLEIELGRLDEAVTHGLQAQALDPRSEWATLTLAEALHLLRRYPEALKAYEHARALQPTNLSTIEYQATVHLAQGDLAGARAVLASAAKDVDSTKLARWVAGAWDLVWLPDSAQQDLVLQLPREIEQPGQTFDEESALRGILHAQIDYLRRDRSRTRVYADSARRGFDAMLRARPYLNRPDNYVLRGLAWAYLGEKAQAIRDGERGMTRALEGWDLMDTGYIRSMLARIYIVVNEPEKAVDQVAVLLKTPSYFAPGWFRVDPNFAPLRGNPRFERLVNGP